MDIAKIEIDKDMCNGCKICVDACFVDVFRWDAKEERPIVAYPEDCAWCFACEIACPIKCLKVEPTGRRRLPSPY